MNEAGVRNAINRKLKQNKGTFEVSKAMVFRELGIDGCDWRLLNKVIGDLGEGDKVVVEQTANRIKFTNADLSLNGVVPSTTPV